MYSEKEVERMIQAASIHGDLPVGTVLYGTVVRRHDCFLGLLIEEGKTFAVLPVRRALKNPWEYQIGERLRVMVFCLGLRGAVTLTMHGLPPPPDYDPPTQDEQQGPPPPGLESLEVPMTGQFFPTESESASPKLEPQVSIESLKHRAREIVHQDLKCLI